MKTKILMGLAGVVAVLFTLSACTTVKNIAGFFGVLSGGKKQASEKNISTFAGTIRPAMGNPESHYNLARYYQERGNHQEAIKEFMKTVAIDPGNVKALNAMGVSYDSLKDYGRASQCYQAALKIEPNSAYVYNNIGQSLLLQGNHLSAIEAFKKAVERDNANARIHNNLGRAYAMAGRHDLAVAEFERGSKGVSAESVLASVLQEAEGRPSTRDSENIAAGENTKAFAARVSGFLQARAAGNVRNEAVVSVKAPKGPAGVGIAANVSMEVSNGNGVNGMAKSMSDYLKKEGFRVTRVTNGERFDVAATCIYCEKDYVGAAKELAGRMPVAAQIKQLPRLDVPQIKVKLLVGRDMIRYMKGLTEEKS